MWGIFLPGREPKAAFRLLNIIDDYNHMSLLHLAGRQVWAL
jgi:hypothetical protein